MALPYVALPVVRKALRLPGIPHRVPFLVDFRGWARFPVAGYRVEDEGTGRDGETREPFWQQVFGPCSAGQPCPRFDRRLRDGTSVIGTGVDVVEFGEIADDVFACCWLWLRRIRLNELSLQL